MEWFGFYMVYSVVLSFYVDFEGFLYLLIFIYLFVNNLEKK